MACFCEVLCTPSFPPTSTVSDPLPASQDGPELPAGPSVFRSICAGRGDVHQLQPATCNLQFNSGVWCLLNMHLSSPRRNGILDGLLAGFDRFVNAPSSSCHHFIGVTRWVCRFGPVSGRLPSDRPHLWRRWPSGSSSADMCHCPMPNRHTPPRQPQMDGEGTLPMWALEPDNCAIVSTIEVPLFHPSTSGCWGLVPARVSTWRGWMDGSPPPFNKISLARPAPPHFQPPMDTHHGLLNIEPSSFRILLYISDL